MPNNTALHLTRLTDPELLARTQGLARRERLLTAEMVDCLAELRRRGSVLREGYSCLFVYCRDALGMSEGEAYNRSAVAEAVVRFPVITEALRAGHVNLTAVRLVAPHLTADNHQAVLASIHGLKKAAVEQVVARLAPRPDAKSLLRRLPARSPASKAPVAAATAGGAAIAGAGVTTTASTPGLATTAAVEGSSGTASEPSATPAAPNRPPAPAPVLAPTSPGRYRLQVTIDDETAGILRRLKDLMRHSVPSGDEAEIVRRSLAALLAAVEKQKLAATTAPRPATTAPATSSRHVPAHVKREVWERDGGQCAFRSSSGHRCQERAFLELHHRHPHALGGPPTTSNVSLRCHTHNSYEAGVDFGWRPGQNPHVNGVLPFA